MPRSFGRTFSAASLRSLGTARARPATRATSTTTARMIHTSFESPPDSGVTSRWMDPQANGSETRNSTAVAIQLDGGHDGARAQRHRRVVALLLEEAHPGGEDRRGPAGQGAERVGDLDSQHPPERKRPGDAADAFHGRRHAGQLGEDERHDDPEPIGPDHGVEGLGDVDEHPDEGPAADERADHHDQCRPAHPAGLHQLRHVDRLGLGGALPDILQELALASQAPAERGVERRRGAAAGGRRARTSGVQAPGRGAGGPFGADRHCRRRHGAGQVAIELIWRRARCGVAEVRQTRSPLRRVDQQRVAADGAVGDACPPQDQQLTVEVVKGGVTDVAGVSVGQRRARRAGGRPAARPWTVPRFPPRRSRARRRPPGRPAW